MKLIYQNILGLALLLIFQGCSGFSANNMSTDVASFNDNTTEQKISDTENKQKLLPIEIDIPQAFIQHGILNTKVHLTAKKELDPTKVAVSLIGLNEGKVIGSKTILLSDQYELPIMLEGDSAVVQLAFDAKELTEYQIKCSWGSAAQKQEKPELKEVTVDSYTNNGEIFYTINGQLLNSSSVTLSQARLALGIFWVNEGQEFIMPAVSDTEALDNEQVVNLDSLALETGQTKQLRIKVDPPVPEVPGGHFVPNLRILSQEVGQINE